MVDYASLFSQGLPYTDFLAKYGNADHLRRWAAVHDQVKLTDTQRSVLATFKRELPVVVLAGAWCGDCVDQCPIFDHFSQAAPLIKLRFFDRDENPELGAALKICGGARVPAVLFLNEDFQELGRYGDRTLAKFRFVAEQTSGASCSTGLVTDKSLFDKVVQEWLDQFERTQLIARTSPRLRERHGD